MTGIANNDGEAPKNLINIITFNVHATATADSGMIPWINIGKANEQILNLIDAEEIVIPEHTITLSVDYPLSSPENFELFSSIGFSRKLLLIEIREQFLMRSKTEQFDIDTLDLVALDVYKTDAGKIEIMLDLDV